jgi:mRNA interferase RelE/StbE
VSSIETRWERRAVKELRRLPHKLRMTVFEAVEDLRQDPLAGHSLSGQWQGLRRLRVGSVRVIYGFDGKELLISVLRVGHRRDVYRRT